MEDLSRETKTLRENPMQILELKSMICEMRISQQLKMAPQYPCLCEDRSPTRGLLWPGQGANPAASSLSWHLSLLPLNIKGWHVIPRA